MKDSIVNFATAETFRRMRPKDEADRRQGTGWRKLDPLILEFFSSSLNEMLQVFTLNFQSMQYETKCSLATATMHPSKTQCVRM